MHYNIKIKAVIYLSKGLFLSLFVLACNTKEENKMNNNYIFLSESEKNMICKCAKVQLEIFTKVQDTIGEKENYLKSDSLKAFEIISQFKSESEKCNKFYLDLTEKKRVIASEFLLTCNEAKILDSLVNK